MELTEKELTEKHRILTAAFNVEALGAVLDSLAAVWCGQLLPALNKEGEQLRKISEAAGKQDDGDALAAVGQTRVILFNLAPVVVYHLLEQIIISLLYPLALTELDSAHNTVLTNRGASKGENPPPRGPQLPQAIEVFKKAWDVNLKQLNSWDAVDVLRLVANCVKHGDGESCKRLKEKRPEWFSDSHVIPLVGFGLKVPESYPESSVATAKQFVAELQQTLFTWPLQCVAASDIGAAAAPSSA